MSATKNGHKMPITVKWIQNPSPSFVYRQDGYELSYSLTYSIAWLSSFLTNSKFSVAQEKNDGKILPNKKGRNIIARR